jgi:uncharacterized protein (TIGR01244 family)
MFLLDAILRTGVAMVPLSWLVIACAAPAPVAGGGAAAAASLDLPNQRNPAPNLFTGGQPTDAQLEAAKAAGYTTVINLRALGEPGVAGQAEKVQSLGMRYVAIPMSGAESLTKENAQLLADALEEASGPVLLHCASGNRVGALLALKAALLDGVEAEQAVALGLAAGMTGLQGAVRELLGVR